MRSPSSRDVTRHCHQSAISSSVWFTRAKTMCVLLCPRTSCDDSICHYNAGQWENLVLSGRIIALLFTPRQIYCFFLSSHFLKLSSSQLVVNIWSGFSGWNFWLRAHYIPSPLIRNNERQCSIRPTSLEHFRRERYFIVDYLAYTIFVCQSTKRGSYTVWQRALPLLPVLSHRHPPLSPVFHGNTFILP